jgi:hypothetical protein
MLIPPMSRIIYAPLFMEDLFVGRDITYGPYLVQLTVLNLYEIRLFRNQLCSERASGHDS